MQVCGGVQSASGGVPKVGKVRLVGSELATTILLTRSPKPTYLLSFYLQVTCYPRPSLTLSFFAVTRSSC